MKLTATVNQATEISEGVWLVPASMDQVLHSKTIERPSLPSLLVVTDANFDQRERVLQFDFGSSELLVLGGRSRGTIVMQENTATKDDQAPARRELGDEGYLKVINGMAPQIRDPGVDLLERIRELDPHGKLERHGRRFINRPDNFVALEPQTRINEIIVHIRGLIEPNLQAVATQRGYSAFKVKSSSDLLEACRAIGLATRKF